MRCRCGDLFHETHVSACLDRQHYGSHDPVVSPLSGGRGDLILQHKPSLCQHATCGMLFIAKSVKCRVHMLPIAMGLRLFFRESKHSRHNSTARLAANLGHVEPS